MARTISQIYNSMVLEKETMTELNALQPAIDNSQTLLSDLTSASRVAVWRLIFFVVSVSIWTLEKLFDEHIAWIDNRASELIVGSKKWYNTVALNYQHGDSLVLINDKFQYATINEANKIINLASVNEVGGQVLVKVAKLSGSTPIPLTTPELEAFQAYMKSMKFAGTVLNAISRPADQLMINYRIYYDPLVLSSTGESLSTPGVYPVEEAINNYIKKLPFDGIFKVTSLTDQIQLANGVVDPVFESAEVKFGANPYNQLIDKYNPNAGYMEIDPANPLSTTITYIQA
jgi:hypothetical protein